MGRTVQCCTADPKRVRLAHEKNLTRMSSRSSSPKKGKNSILKQPKMETIMAPNFDNKYSAVEDV